MAWSKTTRVSLELAMHAGWHRCTVGNGASSEHHVDDTRHAKLSKSTAIAIVADAREKRPERHVRWRCHLSFVSLGKAGDPNDVWRQTSWLFYFS